MKKNISINISGIIFHIEEDGYETLKAYLDSINKYFSTFDDSTEILADIESRIAEILLAKLNEGKQVVTLEDVNALITTMGSVRDFKAAEEQELDYEQTSSWQNRGYNENSKQSEYFPPRQLRRDQKRKILGGVCAGLANYFNVDPVWIRLLFALLTLGYGVIVLVYIVMWIAIPGSYELEEPPINKKMFRDPQTKVLGGVSGGVAAFLGVDIIVVRILFIITSFIGGIGLVAYIVLWMILPEAKTLTDKMQMQGEPVTLSNIENTIKKNLDEIEKEERPFVKILLLPFRILGEIIQGLGKLIKPLLEIIRVAIGIEFILLGLALIFVLIVSTGVLLGLFVFPFSWFASHEELSIPLAAFQNIVPGWTAIAAFFTVVIPGIFLILLGSSILAKRITFSSGVGLSLFVIFVVSILTVGIGIPRIVYFFKEDGEYKVEETFMPTGKTAIFQINEIGLDDYDATSLTLKGHEGSDFKLVKTFRAQGSTRQNAIENAKMVEYHYAVEDSTIIFDSNIRFKDDATFRAQELDLTLYIPYNYPFILDDAMSRFITQHIDHRYSNGYIWHITTNGLECLTCPGWEELQKDKTLTDFDELEISGKFVVRIHHGNEYKVELLGTKEEKDKYNVYRSGQTLVIDYKGPQKDNWNLEDINIREVRINITMPNIKKIEATGYGSIDFDHFSSEDMEIEIRGPIDLSGELMTHDLNLKLTGKAEAFLSGRAEKMIAELSLASLLKAYKLEVNEAIIEVNSSSTAKVTVRGQLEMEEGMASRVDFRGNPTVIHRD